MQKTWEYVRVRIPVNGQCSKRWETNGRQAVAGWAAGGVGAEIAARIMEKAFDWLDAPVLRVTGKDVPMPYAANLEKMALIKAEDVVKAAKAVSYR